MASSTDIWYRLGYALESARIRGPAAPLRSLASRRREESRRRPKDAQPERKGPGDDEGGGLELALAAGAGTLLARVLRVWPGRGRPPVERLLRAGLAGGGAALAREVLTPLLRGEPRLPALDGDLPERVVAGTARGLLYGAVVEPRVPGAPVVRGLLYGTAEYALSPWGGMRGLLGRFAPYRRLPVISGLLAGSEGGEDTLLDHVTFGIALALLYGDAELRIGIGEDTE